MRGLLPVQVAALEAGAHKPGFAYFMEQGLGKTQTALEDFDRKVKAGTATRLVVLCPNSFKGGWVDEIKECGYDFDPYIYESFDEWTNNQWLNKKFDKPPVLIINYESARMAGTKKNPEPGKGVLFIEKFVSGRNAMIVADESIQISTHDSNQTKGALRLGRQFAFRRDLSGKPQKQGPHDLWSQLRFIGAQEGRNYFAFRAAFCRMGGFANKQVLEAQNEDILREQMAPYVFRATKADWTDLPPKAWTIREYTLSPEVKAMYKSMEQEFVLWLESGEAVTIDAAITKYIKLAQIQAGFIFDEEGKINWLVPPERNPRLNALKDWYFNEVTGKAVIVYNHKPIRTLLADQFASEKPAFIRGMMTPEEVREEKRRFNEDPDCKIIFITKAAKYGHTLLGDQTDRELSCYNMAFFENTYSLDDRSQLEDRSHRHGQLQDKMLYTDFVGTPLDRNAVRALQRKENIFQAVFEPLRSRRGQ